MKWSRKGIRGDRQTHAERNGHLKYGLANRLDDAATNRKWGQRTKLVAASDILGLGTWQPGTKLKKSIMHSHVKLREKDMRRLGACVLSNYAYVGIQIYLCICNLAQMTIAWRDYYRGIAQFIDFSCYRLSYQEIHSHWLLSFWTEGGRLEVFCLYVRASACTNTRPSVTLFPLGKAFGTYRWGLIGH